MSGCGSSIDWGGGVFQPKGSLMEHSLGATLMGAEGLQKSIDEKKNVYYSDEPMSSNTGFLPHVMLLKVY